MASGMFSGFVCGAFLGVAGLAALSQMTPLPPGPAPAVPSEAPASGHVPVAGEAPALPEQQAAP